MTWMGIEGRSYAATAAVAVWLTVLFVSLLRRPTWGKHVGYAVLAAFGCSLNIFLVLLLGAHGCTLLLERRLRFTRVFWTWLGAAVVGLAGGLPVLLTAISQSAQIGEAPIRLVGLARNVLVNQWFLGDTPTIYLSGGGSLGDGPGSTLWKPAAVLLAAGCWLIIGWRAGPAHAGRAAQHAELPDPADQLDRGADSDPGRLLAGRHPALQPALPDLLRAGRGGPARHRAGQAAPAARPAGLVGLVAVA